MQQSRLNLDIYFDLIVDKLHFVEENGTYVYIHFFRCKRNGMTFACTLSS